MEFAGRRTGGKSLSFSERGFSVIVREILVIFFSGLRAFILHGPASEEKGGCYSDRRAFSELRGANRRKGDRGYPLV